MSSSSWVITSSWLSGSWRTFLYSSSVFSCHLFLYLLLLLGPYHLCPLLSLSLHEIFHCISNFPEENSSLSPIIFLYFFALMAEEGFLISPFYSLEFCIHMLLSFLFSLLFTSLLFTAICKASLGSHFAFLHFFFLGMVLIPVSCTMSRPQSIVHQALCLSDLVP